MKKALNVILSLCVLIVGLFLWTDLSYGAEKKAKGTAKPSAPVKELKITEVKKGTGAEAVPLKTVVVHYTGTFPDGKKFDSSLDRKEPFQFTLGVGQVIKGWDQGVQGMKVGGKRKLVVPSDLAYGTNGIRNPATQEYVIPPDSVLHFDVELLEVK